jgi:hypothetical protein
MFSRKNRAERTAAQAWDYLSSAMAAAGESARAAGESARDAGKHTADLASGRAADFAGLANKQSTLLAERVGKKGSKLADKASRQSSKLAGTAGRKGATLSDRASSKVNSAADEAWARANAAANALAGRKPGRPWGVIVGAGLVGVALGWVAATTARAAIERQAENEELELAETAVVVTPTRDS